MASGAGIGCWYITVRHGRLSLMRGVDRDRWSQEADIGWIRMPRFRSSMASSGARGEASAYRDVEPVIRPDLLTAPAMRRPQPPVGVHGGTPGADGWDESHEIRQGGHRDVHRQAEQVHSRRPRRRRRRRSGRGGEVPCQEHRALQGDPGAGRQGGPGTLRLAVPQDPLRSGRRLQRATCW